MDDDFVQEAYEPEDDLLVPVDDLADISGEKLNKKAAARAAAESRLDEEVPVPVHSIPLPSKKPTPSSTLRAKPVSIPSTTSVPQPIKQKKQAAPVLGSKKPMPQKVVSAPAIKPVFSRIITKKEVVQQTVAKRQQPHWDWRKISVAVIALLVLGGIVFSYAFSHAEQQPVPVVKPSYDFSC